jgi:hypothetical protein
MLDVIHNLHERLVGKVPADCRRSSHWREDRAGHLKLHGSCAGCAGTKKLEVHHIVPFHLAPARERDPTNWITLCESGKGGINCHLAIGHLGDYKCFNPNVVTDAAAWLAKRQAAPRALSETASAA